MNEITCKLADIVVKVRYLYPEFAVFCRGYETQEAPQEEIVITREDIEYERSRSEEGDRFPDFYLETLAVYRLFCERAAKYGVILFHSSAVCEGGQAYLFSAPSGTGKSTHARLWRENFPSCRMINDDKPLLRFFADGVRVYGTPWNGKHRLGENFSAPLQAICFIRQAKENTIAPMDSREALLRIVPQTYLPRQEEACGQVLAYVRQLTRCARFYSLGCNVSAEAAVLSHNAMVKGD